jgi:hypothetical protein
MAYIFLWRAACGVIGSLGIGLGLIVLPAELLIPLGLLTMVLGLTAAVGHTSTDIDDRPEQRTTGQAAFLATLPCTGFLALAGLGVGLGPVPLLLLLLALGFTSPPVVRWLAIDAPPDQPPSTGGVGVTISTADLCRQWHDSYDALQHAPTPAARLRIVTTRQDCLDELERRDPEGLNAWLSSNASAAGDPSRFLRIS